MIGGPGSGKGTQVKSYKISIIYLDFKIEIRQRLTSKFLKCAKIVEKWNFCHLSSGSLLRQVARENTTAGIDLREKMKKGKLVDDDTITSIILEKIQKSESEIILLDGFPRNISQTEKLNAKVSQLSVTHNALLTKRLNNLSNFFRNFTQVLEDLFIFHLFS